MHLASNRRLAPEGGTSLACLSTVAARGLGPDFQQFLNTHVAGETVGFFFLSKPEADMRFRILFAIAHVPNSEPHPVRVDGTAVLAVD